MRLVFGGFLTCVLILSYIRVSAAGWPGVPYWVDFYLMLLLIAVVPVAGLFWVIPKEAENGVAVEAFAGFLYRLLKGLLLVFVGLYAIGIYLMIRA